MPPDSPTWDLQYPVTDGEGDTEEWASNSPSEEYIKECREKDMLFAGQCVPHSHLGKIRITHGSR